MGVEELVVGVGDSALEAAVSIAEEQGTTVTLSYRSEAFSRAKQKNRDKVDRAAKAGRLRVLMKSNVKKIEGKQVVVHADEVKNPVAVRYAYTMNPVGANLYNRDGLPASPFRTDDW